MSGGKILSKHIPKNEIEINLQKKMVKDKKASKETC